MCEEVVAQIFSEMFNTKRLVANKIELSQLNEKSFQKSKRNPWCKIAYKNVNILQKLEY